MLNRVLLRRAMSVPLSSEVMNKQLTGTIGPKLRVKETIYHEEVSEVPVLPPGVETLSQWGATRFRSGKRRGKPFLEIYNQDPLYAHMLWNRQASAWARSFQHFCRSLRRAKAPGEVAAGSSGWEHECEISICETSKPHIHPLAVPLTIKLGSGGRHCSLVSGNT